MAELITASNYAESIECPLTYGDVDLDLIYDEVYVEPADATLDPENDYSVTDSEPVSALIKMQLQRN